MLGQGLTALLNAMTDSVSVTVVNSTDAVLEVMVRQQPSLVLVDGGISDDELATFFNSRANATLFPPILLLVETVEQAEVARQEQVSVVIKGHASDLITTVEGLLRSQRERSDGETTLHSKVGGTGGDGFTG